MDFRAARAKLVEHLSTEIRDERVLAAMASVPRQCIDLYRFLGAAREKGDTRGFMKVLVVIASTIDLINLKNFKLAAECIAYLNDKTAR